MPEFDKNAPLTREQIERIRDDKRPYGRLASLTGMMGVDGIDAAVRQLCELALVAPSAERSPIDMLLFCPRCGKQHIDAPLGEWTNPPHATHTCQHCGLLWRPSNAETNGVMTLPVLEEKHAARIEAAVPSSERERAFSAGMQGKARAALLDVSHERSSERIYTKADIEAACALVLAGYRSKPVIDNLVDRFLAWPLPDSVCSDGCATERDYGKAQGWPKRCGTNLLTADEARQMLEHVLETPIAASAKRGSMQLPPDDKSGDPDPLC